MLVWICDNMAKILSFALALLTFTSMCNAVTIPPSVVRQPDVTDYQAGLHAERHHQYGTAMTLLKTAAKAGNSEAAYEIGQLYYEGCGVPRDYYKAMQWYRKAAAAGNAKAAITTTL